MHVLKAHRARVTRLRASLDKLFSLHQEHLSNWSEIVRIVAEKGTNDPPEIKPHFDRTQELAREITKLRRDTFGALPHQSELNIASLVESSYGDATGESAKSAANTGQEMPDEGSTEEITEEFNEEITEEITEEIMEDGAEESTTEEITVEPEEAGETSTAK